MKTSIARAQPRSPASRKPVGLALQGGGSWGAYTWGVLDSLLASRSLTVAQLSGTSAGAINAAIVASALAKGSAAQARDELRLFWLSIARPAMHDIGRELWGPVERKEIDDGWVGNPSRRGFLRVITTAHYDEGPTSNPPSQ